LITSPVAVGDRLNLGSGRNPLVGWINADINPFSGAELWLDLRDHWPIRDETVSIVYSRHCMEHFNEKDLLEILRQAYRVLQPTGVIRVGVPSLETAIHQYLQKDFSFAGWLDQTEPHAKLFIRYITDNGNHPILLDFAYLSRLLSDAGFIDVTRCGGGQSRYVDTASLAPGDCPADSTTLYVEATKR
jgi:predicted SAM-dependent methyltransferase